jgi:hypothetical protein
MTLTRRRLLASLLSAAAVLPFVQLLPARAGAGFGGLGEGFYMVNGWILTAADVEALGLGDEARRLA